MDHKIILQCRVCLDECDEKTMFDLFKETCDKAPPKSFPFAANTSANTRQAQDDAHEVEVDDGNDEQYRITADSPLLSTSTPYLKLYEKVQYCCGVLIRDSREMPTKICQKCFDMTRMWYSYRQMCLNSQVYLESLCKDREAMSEDKEHDENDYLEYLLDDLQTFRTAALASNQSLAEVTRAATTMGALDHDDDTDQIEEYLYIEPQELNPDSGNEMHNIIQNIKKEDNSTDAEGDLEMGFFAGDTNVDDIDYEPKPKVQTRQCATKPIKPRLRRRRRLRGEIKTNTDSEQKKRLAQSTFMCATCGNVYTKRAAFTYHMSLHSNVRPHECEICGKNFRQMCELKNHMRRHTGEKPYKCSYCDRHFIDRSEKHRHERVHTNTRPYTCKVCDKSFMYSAILKNHTKVHSGEKNYNCLVCQKSFTLPHQLKAHQQTITHKQKEVQMLEDQHSDVLEADN